MGSRFVHTVIVGWSVLTLIGCLVTLIIAIGHFGLADTGQEFAQFFSSLKESLSFWLVLWGSFVGPLLVLRSLDRLFRDSGNGEA